MMQCPERKSCIRLARNEPFACLWDWLRVKVRPAGAVFYVLMIWLMAVLHQFFASSQKPFLLARVRMQIGCDALGHRTGQREDPSEEMPEWLFNRSPNTFFPANLHTLVIDSSFHWLSGIHLHSFTLIHLDSTHSPFTHPHPHIHTSTSTHTYTHTWVT